jgi:hypothetical protein
MEAFFKAKGLGPAEIIWEREKLGHEVERNLFRSRGGRERNEFRSTEADLAWHVHARERWVLD